MTIAIVVGALGLLGYVGYRMFRWQPEHAPVNYPHHREPTPYDRPRVLTPVPRPVGKQVNPGRSGRAAERRRQVEPESDNTLLYAAAAYGIFNDPPASAPAEPTSSFGGGDSGGGGASGSWDSGGSYDSGSSGGDGGGGGGGD